MNAIVRYYRGLSDPRAEYIARYASVPHASNVLRKQKNLNESLRLLNDPSFPAQRAAEILRNLTRDINLNPLYCLKSILRYEVLEAFWQRFGQKLIDELSSSNLQSRAGSIRILLEFTDFLDDSERSRVLEALKDFPPEIQLGENLYLAASDYVWGLRIKIKSAQILDKIDEIISAAPPHFPFEQTVNQYLRHNLEFIPDEDPIRIDPCTGENVEARVGRRFDKTGTAVETISKMLRMEEITEDQIKRLHGTCYCQKDYGKASLYRTEPTFRAGRRLIRAEDVPEEMENLISWVNSSRARNLHPFVRAALFYMHYDQIHPFEGRTKHAARFFMSKILLQGRNNISYLPVLDDFQFNMPVFFKRPEIIPQDGFFFFGDPSLIMGPQTGYTLINEDRELEFVFFLLGHYYRSLILFYGAYATERMHKLFGEIRDILLSECSPESRMLFET